MPGTLGDNIFVRLVLAQAHCVEDALKSWQPPRDRPPTEASLSRLVDFGVRMVEDMESAYTEGFGRDVKDASMSVEDFRKEFRAFSEVCRVGALVVYRLWECLDQITTETGLPIPRSERLLDSVERFKQLQRRLAEEWPVAEAEEEQGEGVELDDAFADIAGMDKAAWLERVAQHKRKHPPHGQERSS
jgi:hypothetical protein